MQVQFFLGAGVEEALWTTKWIVIGQHFSLPRKSTRKGKVLPNYYPFGCPECFLHASPQEELDLHRQQDHNVAPVRQVKDSEEAAAYKEQVKANKLARRRKQKVQASTTQDLARKEVVIKSVNTTGHGVRTHNPSNGP